MESCVSVLLFHVTCVCSTVQFLEVVLRVLWVLFLISCSMYVQSNVSHKMYAPLRAVWILLYLHWLLFSIDRYWGFVLEWFMLSVSAFALLIFALLNRFMVFRHIFFTTIYSADIAYFS